MTVSDHRVQIRMDEATWERAQLAASANGVLRLSKLFELLLERECGRLEIGTGRGAPAELEDENGEHRLQIRMKRGLWARAKVMATALGFTALSDLSRHLLEAAVERFEREQQGKARRNKKRKKVQRARGTTSGRAGARNS